jgi:hypothetical protein
VAERVREEHQARVQARLERAAGREVSVPPEPAPAENTAGASAVKPQSLEDIRREARENWLRLRQSQSQDHADSALPVTNDRLQNDDLAR